MAQNSESIDPTILPQEHQGGQHIISGSACRRTGTLVPLFSLPNPSWFRLLVDVVREITIAFRKARQFTAISSSPDPLVLSFFSQGLLVGHPRGSIHQFRSRVRSS